MTRLKRELIESAVKEHRKIFPCNSQCCVEDCFTVEGNLLLFWFNTEDNSTHLLSKEL